MDYGKTGNPKRSKDTPRAHDHPKHGAPKPSETEAAKKAALLARMKAAAEAKKTD